MVVNVIYRLTGSCKLKFLMTAIRNLNFQYAWFQHVTRNTTKMGFSNDRFGFINPKSVIRFHFVLFLSPLYCDHFGEGIAGYVETEREARQRRERRNERKDHKTITEYYHMSV